jgi:hypothetical protein
VEQEIVMRSSIIPRAALLALAALALAGCASVGEDECLAMDWRTVGYEDGATGQGIERLTSRRQACAKHGVAPDLDAYRSGREEGLLEFCQPANGFRVGARGRGYAGACPEYLAPAFSDAYQAGRDLWRLESRVSDTIRGIANRRAEVERIDEGLVSHQLRAGRRGEDAGGTRPGAAQHPLTGRAPRQAAGRDRHAGTRPARLRGRARRIPRHAGARRLLNPRHYEPAPPSFSSRM